MDSPACPLNPEPTEAQRALFIRHKARGTTPGNPKWYRPMVVGKRAVFVPGPPPKYPHIETGGQWKFENGDLAPDPWKAVRNKTGGRYIHAYQHALGLKP